MSEIKREELSVDPNASPFESVPIEGIPFEKGSEEDLAIRRILRRARERDERTVIER